MPGFDGTGPRGDGPVTGGGRGYCVRPLADAGQGYSALGPLSRLRNLWTRLGTGVLPIGGPGTGAGRGMGRGMGRGRGRRGW